MAENRQFDIAIIGTGITGLSAAHHLLRLGTRRLCFFSDQHGVSTTQHSAGLIIAGLMDNITRMAHRHGHGIAQEVWEWSSLAYDRTLEFCQHFNIDQHSGQRVRWIFTPDELQEAQSAEKIFHDLGFSTELKVSRSLSSEDCHPVGLLATQDEGHKASAVNLHSFLNALEHNCASVPRLSKVISLVQTADGILIRDSNSQEYLVEAVILANHLAIAELLPSLKPALVSYADQWHEFDLKQDLSNIGLSQGTYFSWKHAHYWGGVVGPNRIRLGGARYLRPLAGFEAQNADLLSTVEENLRESWHRLFPDNPIIISNASGAGLDCWPCDELPIVGPMFGEPRILVATGYMGLGTAMGFYAGCCVAELIQGLRPPLPRSLWPERLRTLAP